MPIPAIASLPPGLQLSGAYVVRFTALDPTTGAPIAGVNITGAALQLNNLRGSAPAALEAGPFMLVPGSGA